MKKNNLLRLVILSFFISTYSFAQNSNSNQFPPTDESVHLLIKSLEIMTFIEKTYRPQISQKNLSFQWKFDWNQPLIGAGSSLYQNEFSILLYGGLIRAPLSNLSPLSLTLCHEMGHLLGGTPHQRFGQSSEDDWSSAEGQADWFSATDCLPKVYQFFSKNQNSSPAQESLKQEMKTAKSRNLHSKICQDVSAPELCQWILFSAESFVTFSQNYFQPVSPTPSLADFAKERPPQTLIGSYPSLQCRLDTYRIGALLVSKSQQSESLLQSPGRPRCWYKAP